MHVAHIPMHTCVYMHTHMQAYIQTSQPHTGTHMPHAYTHTQRYMGCVHAHKHQGDVIPVVEFSEMTRVSTTVARVRLAGPCSPES